MPSRATFRRRVRFAWRRWLTAAAVVTVCIGFAALLRVFYLKSTLLVPRTGGTYIEGSVGEFYPLNPWFTVTNDVNRDIVSLIFSGLLRYNPETKQIESDLADAEVSADGRMYTLRLKEDLFWHDSSPEAPHPVTSDDVLFTFKTVQDPKFPNSLLRQNFLGVEIEKLDERAVRFKLEEPYRFFPSNLTLGLLPARSFEGIPVERLDQAIDFGFNPVGAGPYTFKGIVQTELSTEVTLERFARLHPPKYHLDSVIFRVFPDYQTLLSDLRNLHGVRLVPRNEDGDPLVPRPYKAETYTLPQYVALFFNLENPFLQDKKLRLALQLGTDKNAVVDAIQEKTIVDTPLLEIDVTDWRYQFDAAAAQGALFSSDWHLPEKVRLQRMLEIREANDTGALSMPSVVLLDTGAVLTLTGSLVEALSTGALVNGLPIEASPTQSGAWIAALPTKGTGALRLGMNIVRLWSEDGEPLDTAYVWRTADPALYSAAAREQELIDRFLRSRSGDAEIDEGIAVSQMYLQDGFLRERLPTDPQDIRINDKGQKLSLRLVTSPSPPQYAKIAEVIKKQWEQLGVHVGIEVPPTRAEFEEKLLARDYDILLFGQSLLDNLDSYPYWHSSGVQKTGGNRNELRLDAYNLSQYSSLEADSLLELIRKTGDGAEREESLAELRDVLKDDMPAVFLYSPLYTFAYHQDLHGVEIGNLSLHSDRFLSLFRWYVREERVFKPGMSWLSFFGWFFSFL